MENVECGTGFDGELNDRLGWEGKGEDGRMWGGVG